MDERFSGFGAFIVEPAANLLAREAAADRLRRRCRRTVRLHGVVWQLPGHDVACELGILARDAATGQRLCPSVPAMSTIMIIKRSPFFGSEVSSITSTASLPPTSRSAWLSSSVQRRRVPDTVRNEMVQLVVVARGKAFRRLGGNFARTGKTALLV